MLVRVYESRARDRGIDLRLSGPSFNDVPMLSSFIVVPVVLIDNAIKHSKPGTEIVVYVSDSPRNDGVYVEISSIGDVVPDDERDHLFERGFRGSNARLRGSGLGLSVAEHVANANGFSIEYQAGWSDRHETGTNKFCFEISGIDFESA